MSRALLDAGFAEDDIEAGRVGYEEAQLLLRNTDELIEQLNDANRRLVRHNKNETNRVRGGLELDLERYLKTGVCRD